MVMKPSTKYDLLIADDNSGFREVIREILESRCVLRVHEVGSGEEAIEYAQSVEIDIVLLDMHMHVMTGLEALRQLKSLNIIRPCILITSDDDLGLRRDAAEADAYSVLNKPIRRTELCTTVVNALVEAYDDPGMTELFPHSA